jgi:hypothetical protein
MSSHSIRHVISKWDANGMTISPDDAYEAFLQFSQERREYSRAASRAAPDAHELSCPS